LIGDVSQDYDRVTALLQLAGALLKACCLLADKPNYKVP
jgi:hypothetical protein